MDFDKHPGHDFFHFWLVELIRLVVLDLAGFGGEEPNWEEMDMREGVPQDVPFSKNTTYMQCDLPGSAQPFFRTLYGCLTSVANE